jgi:HK97 family phage major capsid protein
MGLIADLLEKKALQTITDEEQKQLDALLAEAKMAQKDAGDDSDEGGEEEAVDALAQKMADMMTKSADEQNARFEKLLKSMEDRQDASDKSANSVDFIVDKTLGKKHTVEELSEIKIALPGRKAAGKAITEISQKSVEFLSALYSGDKQKLQILSEGTAADGGYLVPEEFANMIVEDIRDQNIMRQLASVMTTNTDTVHIPSLISRPRAAWRSEKAVKSTSTATFSENVLTPYSLAAIVPLSNELVADAQLGVGGSIVNYIAGLMSTALSEAEEQAFWTGSGTGRPSGVDGGVYTLRTVAAGAGATDVQRADAITQAFHTHPQGYRNKGVWVGNMGTWAEVGRLKDSQNRYLLTDLANSPTQTLKGRPVYESNYLAGGTLLYGDFSYYQIVDREGISVRVSDEATVAGSSAFEKNLTYVRVEKRVDAELLLPAAIVKVTGIGTP